MAMMEWLRFCFFQFLQAGAVCLAYERGQDKNCVGSAEGHHNGQQEEKKT